MTLLAIGARRKHYRNIVMSAIFFHDNDLEQISSTKRRA